ncbi:unnamed protein product [Symbiodinium necroappetens]|uniref:Uncharacterized protein n=1 Tax=Symbiodinium necroappetens TaxID=1628268 RepID=A0A812P7M1_9DINO|nr:unnamed protein product [Symbiodinium necroappetens]
MTCSELPEEECASTHFFETVGACERRLCVWAAPWKCTVDYTQACISCNWPCGRKASTSTTSTTTTTTLTTTTITSSTTSTVTETTTTTSTSTSTVTTTSTSTPTTTTTSTTTVTGSTTDRYHLAVATPYLTKSGVVVPTRCFEFCDRTNVRSMYVSCHQLSPEMCQSESFYETDLKGNRRHCILIGESCTVDKSFVCNASMPICQVSDDSGSEASPESAAVANGTGPPSTSLSRTPDAGTSSTLPVEMPRITNGSDIVSGEHGEHEITSARQVRFDDSTENPKAFEGQDLSGESVDNAKAFPRKDQLLPHAVMQSVVAAAQECLAVGLNVLDIYEVVNATLLHVPAPIKSPAEMSLREAVEVALLAGVSSAHILQDLQHAGIGTEEPASLPPLPPLPPPRSGRVETVEINPHGPDRIVFRAPYTEVTTTTSSQLSHTSLPSDARCSSLCSKQEVKDCGSIEPELCTSEEFYSTSQGQTSVCELVEDVCQPGPSFSCESHADCVGHNRGTLGVDSDTVDRFCKSLCFKQRVSTGNCSTLQEYDCKSRMYYMDAAGGKVLCQWEAAGYCHLDLSARCPKKQLCPGTTTSSPVVPPFCYTLCGKTDVGSHVSACEELPEAQCKTWQYYATIDGHRALCSWSEIGVCSLDTSASCPPLMPLCPSSTTATTLLPFADYRSYLFAPCAVETLILQVMRKQSDSVALNRCARQEAAAYSFWEEALMRAGKPDVGQTCTALSA